MFLILLLKVHLLSTWFMVGLIWFVQVVHYPLFEKVGKAEFPGYEHEHAKRTTWLVLPPMLVELTCSFGIWLQAPGALSTLGLVLVVAVWISTLLVQSPLHALLLSGFRNEHWVRLVSTNRIRVALWTLRGAVAAVLSA